MTDDEMIWVDNPNLPGQRVYTSRGSLAHLGRSGWQEGPAELEPSPDELDAELLAAAGYGPEPEPEPVDYTGWLKADLVAEAESRGLDTTGTKDDLIGRLDGNDVTATEPDQPAEESAS
jgi:hypothetical protein